MSDLHHKTISQLLRDLDNKAFSSVELTAHYLDRIERLDPAINSYITVLREPALARAAAMDVARQKGTHPPLAGIPIAHKDIICTQGVRTSAGSRMLDNFIAPYNATLVEQLNDAGVVTLGKTNMDEFAMGSSNENSYYGPVNNPWRADRVPGGSSGGSAASLAAGLCTAATGTDTGGSIRQPAAFCGITGLKPTYGRVSRWGVIAYASSLDQAGPMAQTAEDAAHLLQAMAGFDHRDSTSINQPVPDYLAQINGSIKGLKIGICTEYFDAGLDDDIRTAVMAAAKTLESMGAILSEVSLPNTQHAIPAYYVIAPAECSSNLSRYDGVRFGYRCADPESIEDLYKRSRSEGFGREVKSRIMVGTFALSAGRIFTPSPSTSRVSQPSRYRQVKARVYPSAYNLSVAISMKAVCSKWPITSSKHRTGTLNVPTTANNQEIHHARLGNRHRSGDPYPAQDQIENIFGCQHRLRCGAQYASLRH